MKPSQCLKFACLMFATMLPAFAQAQFTFFTNNGAITITGYSGSNGIVVIPDTTNGYPVVNIGSNAFYNCTSLTNVTIGTNVVSIGDYAFAECDSLTNVLIPNSLANIGDGVFYDCYGLTSVIIDNGVTNIGDYVFYECLSLTSVTIGKGLTSIGDHGFSGCTSLTVITVDADNANYSTLNGILFDKMQTQIIKYPVSIVGSYVIPNGVTNIGVEAFAECVRLTSVTIGTNVTCIGDDAFFFCSGLTNVSIPKSVSVIGDCPFGDCTSLMAISVDTNNPVYNSLDGVLLNHNRTTLIQCPGAKAGELHGPRKCHQHWLRAEESE